MANVSLETQTRKVVTGINLNLSLEEAIVLVGIFYNIGGSPSTSNRKYVESMLDALKDAGIDLPSGSQEMGIMGDITFTSYTAYEDKVSKLADTVESLLALRDVDTAELRLLVKGNDKIRAIKLFRELCVDSKLQCGLRDAKEEIDRRIKEYIDSVS